MPSDIQNQSAIDNALEAQRAFEVYAYLMRAAAANPRLQENPRFSYFISMARAEFEELYEAL